jgi:hypothetical protein
MKWRATGGEQRVARPGETADCILTKINKIAFSLK